MEREITGDVKLFINRVVKGQHNPHPPFNNDSVFFIYPLDLNDLKYVSYFMYKYEIIIYWSEEDSSFIAEVPELPGCMADGKTNAEALQNVEEVIREWIETATELGRTIPEPKGRLVFA